MYSLAYIKLHSNTLLKIPTVFVNLSSLSFAISIKLQIVHEEKAIYFLYWPFPSWYPAFTFRSVWLKGIKPITNKGDRVSPWKIPLWIFTLTSSSLPDIKIVCKDSIPLYKRWDMQSSSPISLCISQSTNGYHRPFDNLSKPCLTQPFFSYNFL